MKKSSLFDIELSSQILGFMRWIPIITNDEIINNWKLLEAIDNVIYEIQDQLLDNYSDIVTLKSLKECKDGRLFIGNNETDDEYLVKMKKLRELLIKALYGQEYIKSEFKKHYQLLHK